MLVRVFEIPNVTRDFVFNKPAPYTFRLVDWFRIDEPEIAYGFDPATDDGRAKIAEFIARKQYYKPRQPYLVLMENHTFTIEYKAP